MKKRRKLSSIVADQLYKKFGSYCLDDDLERMKVARWVAKRIKKARIRQQHEIPER